MQKILVATTNSGKLKEFVSELIDLPFTLVSLTDVGLDKIDVEEPFLTTWENALQKAKFFAERSQLPTIADDTGFFIKHLKGEPGVRAARYAATPEECRKKILDGLRGIPEAKRVAYFETAACFYNPRDEHFAMFRGRVSGRITQKVVALPPPKGMVYDTIFYYPPARKTFVEMTVEEKNLVSHRGRSINQLKLYLLRQFSFNQLVVPGALIIKDRKMFLNKRRDHNPALNNKWEFVGGGVDPGEGVEDCMHREVKEETGYTVKILEPIPKIHSRTTQGISSDDQFQIFLVLFIVKIVKGTLKTAPAESAGHGWFTYAEALKLDFLPLNKDIILENKTLLKKYIN